MRLLNVFLSQYLMVAVLDSKLWFHNELMPMGFYIEGLVFIILLGIEE